MWENPIFFNVSYIFFIRSVGALGIAIIASSCSEHRNADATFSIGPITGMSSIFVPIRFLSSSRKADTVPNIFFLFLLLKMLLHT